MQVKQEAPSCPVCCEGYTPVGDHMPLLFPCNHSACDTCVEQILTENDYVCFVCPVCGKKREIYNRKVSFPRNPYIIDTLRFLIEKRDEEKKRMEESEKRSEFKQCSEHGLDLSLYCLTKSCQEAICQICLVNSHIGHEVVDVMCEISSKIPAILDSLNQQRFTQQTVHKKCKESLEKLKKMKIQQVEKYDEMIENLEKLKKERVEKIDEMMEITRDRVKEVNTEVGALSDELVKMNDIKQKLDEKSKLDLLEMEDVNDAANAKEARELDSSYYEYVETGAGDTCGKLVKKKRKVSLPKCHVQSTFLIAYDSSLAHIVEPLTDGTFIVAEAVRYKNRIRGILKHELHVRRYDNRGNVLCEAELTAEPVCMKEVTFEGKPCLIVSYRDHNQIDFRDIETLETVVFTLTFDDFTPNHMIRASPSKILCISNTQYSTAGYWSNGDSLKANMLDCSTSTPVVENTALEVDSLPGWYNGGYAQHEGKQFLISFDVCAIHVYNMTSGQPQWNVEGKLAGMNTDTMPRYSAADNSGHLFAWDRRNLCIQMFSVSDGRYMGCVLRGEEQDISECKGLFWCERTSSLIVHHQEDNKDYISAVTIKM